ncbi:aminodeoxychorismate synthase component I [Paenibacillus dendritiformis]|uniref:aminodeoxychorismate synthase component I n=1 Tax=Paenibacillus dendritiformis TaxID=130049 RepID=UPI0018CD2292|nr:aminodeoxychorismate synthase component I [Paenibacillus dendritiformis]
MMKQGQTSPYILFDFADADRGMERKFFSEPVEIIVAWSRNEVRDALRRAEEWVGRGYYAAGYVSYEAAPAFDPVFSVHRNTVMPLVWFGIFSGYTLDGEPAGAGDYRLSGWEPAVAEPSYHDNIHKIHEAIARGDTYQVNYTMRLRSQFEGDAYAFYTRLCKAQQANYSAMLQLGDFSILSASPELFFRKNGKSLETRPMKGTVKRGLTVKEDERLSDWLRQSEKNRAENVMITDLLRNDLGMVAEAGSVQVPKLFEIEKYYTLFQMTSTVTATTMPDIGIDDIFAALFPCGSITGAPKISTMNLICELEEAPREIYCGSIGLIRPDGSAVFNVAIRTVWIDHRRSVAEYGVGGGITWDSTAADEYQEARTKALLLTEVRPDFELLESLRLENGVYQLLEQHIARMADSAVYFDFQADKDALRQALLQHAHEFPAGVRKVRLLLSRTGLITVQSEPIAERQGPAKAVLASSPVSSSDRFLYHKTTNRAVYAKHDEQKGDAYDVLLWNENGELTEFTTGNLVLELNGTKYTPPQDSGLLAGTLRSELIAAGTVTERTLAISDIPKASHIWLINSVRGWIPVTMLQDSLDRAMNELSVV